MSLTPSTWSQSHQLDLRKPTRYLDGGQLELHTTRALGEGIRQNSEIQRTHLRTYLLLTTDTCAINHILTHANDYRKPSQVRHAVAQITGEGLAVAEGAQHRRQRRIMNPAFGPAQIRGLTEIFVAKAIRFATCGRLRLPMPP
ncbi:hypothetical protein PAXINDRAFT_168641 [Paxillus involutus ATCC 200175]|nr:hypothetical protein PAXINDRAFT_168641 [Paxillus involutus ATCC 200175]